MGCDCQLLIKENDDDDDTSRTILSTNSNVASTLLPVALTLLLAWTGLYRSRLNTRAASTVSFVQQKLRYACRTIYWMYRFTIY